MTGGGANPAPGAAPFPDDDYLNALRWFAPCHAHHCRNHRPKIDFFTTSQVRRMKFTPQLPHASRRQLIRQYDDIYALSAMTPDEHLLMSREKLYLNYGVRDADLYRTSERITIALEILVDDRLRGKTILDYGCGSAKAGVVFAQEGAQVFGFDISTQSIQLGMRRAKVNGVEQQVNLVVASGDKLPFGSATLDYVFGYEVLYYLNGKLDFSPEILRVLKPGGKAVFCEALGGNPLLATVRAILRMVTRTINRSGGIAFTPREIRSAFTGASKVEILPVNALAMAKRVLSGRDPVSTGVLAALKRIDSWLTRYPVGKVLCGEVVIVVIK